MDRSQIKWSMVDLGLKPRSSEFETQALEAKRLYTAFHFNLHLKEELHA